MFVLVFLVAKSSESEDMEATTNSVSLIICGGNGGDVGGTSKGGKGESDDDSDVDKSDSSGGDFVDTGGIGGNGVTGRRNVDRCVSLMIDETSEVVYKSLLVSLPELLTDASDGNGIVA